VQKVIVSYGPVSYPLVDWQQVGLFFEMFRNWINHLDLNDDYGLAIVEMSADSASCLLNYVVLLIVVACR